MRKIFLSLVALILFCLISSQTSLAADPVRYATCDACGLCPTIVNGTDTPCTVVSTQIPGDWEKCASCLYPTLYPPTITHPDPNVPEKCATLIVHEPQPLITPPNLVATGRQFTMLGCITSGSSVGFDNKDGGPGGAPTFVQALLNVLFSLAGGLAFLYLMYGGFIVLTSQADPERLNYGRRLIYGAIAGLIITLGSVFIVNLIGSGILHIPGFGGAV